MLPLLVLVASAGAGLIVAAEGLARNYRLRATGRWWYSSWSATPWSYRLGGALFAMGAILATIAAVRQNFLFVGLLAGIVVIPLLVGIAGLLAVTFQRWGAWAVVAFFAAVMAAVILIAER